MTLSSDESVERSLVFIRNKASEFAAAKADRVYLEQFRKSKKAILMNQAEREGVRTLGAQEIYAYAHPEYLELLLGLKAAVEREEYLSLQLKAAQTNVELYRTAEASKRAERKAYGA